MRSLPGKIARAAKRMSLLFISIFYLFSTLPLQGKDTHADDLTIQPPVFCTASCSLTTAAVNQGFLDQATGFFSSLFNTQDWPARWQCGTWTSFHGWLYIISDVVTGVCYFLIPMSLWFLYKNRQWKSFRLVIFLFILFIVACGSTHFIDAAAFWWPAYRLNALMRLITAVASVTTLIVLIKIGPRISQLKGPDTLEKVVAERTSELRELNERLRQEIESRKQAEDNLAKREKHFRLLIENIGDGIVLNDERTNILYQSPSVSRILGYSAEERLGKPVLNYIHENDKQDFIKFYERLAILPGQPLPFLYRFKHKNGHYIWLEGVVTNLIHDKDINGMVANYRDVSERKLTDEKLGRERYLLRTLIDNLPDYIYVKDAELRHVINNKANVGLIGAANEEETLGKTVMDYFDASIAIQFMQADREVLESGEPVINLEEMIIGHSQEIRWLLTSKIPLKENAKAVGLVGISRDITDRKKAELVLKELNASLATQASKLAASNTELERFAYVASHDLQEPLRMVRSFLQLLKKKYESNLDKEAHEYIDYAVDGAERMKQLIKDLLEYSRVGFIQEKFESIDMNTLVQHTLQMIRQSHRDSQATFRVKDLPPVSGNKTQLSQLLQNLIANALKYRSDVPPEITIQAEQEPGFWKFSITDNGIGIDPRFFDKIFIIFQRLNTQSDRKGSGLGLAICKKIVEGHGGKIWVESKLGVGSTFHFTVIRQE